MVEVNSLLTELRKLNKEQLKEVEFHLWATLSELELEAANE
tara:strand:+ start:142 stop:264 length:123 start_codon:yes stop_codon:yes gene_type:complete